MIFGGMTTALLELSSFDVGFEVVGMLYGHFMKVVQLRNAGCKEIPLGHVGTIQPTQTTMTS